MKPPYTRNGHELNYKPKFIMNGSWTVVCVILWFTNCPWTAFCFTEICAVYGRLASELQRYLYTKAAQLTSELRRHLNTFWIYWLFVQPVNPLNYFCKLGLHSCTAQLAKAGSGWNLYLVFTYTAPSHESHKLLWTSVFLVHAYPYNAYHWHPG